MEVEVEQGHGHSRHAFTFWPWRKWTGVDGDGEGCYTHPPTTTGLRAIAVEFQRVEVLRQMRSGERDKEQEIMQAPTRLSMQHTLCF